MATNSRYDFMTEGKSVDEISGSSYPDPLSLNYLNLTTPFEYTKDFMDDSKIIAFWAEAYNIYNVVGYDDIVLTLNGIPHKNFLKPGDTVYFPSISDMKSSFSK